MTPGRFKTGTAQLWALAAMALPLVAQAQAADPHRWQLNMARGVTPTSHAAYDAHMITLWICVVIGVIVFGAMAIAMFKFRKSKGAVPDTEFTHSTKLEILWTALPILILVGLAFPATSGLMRMYDTRDAAMTVKVTGYRRLIQATITEVQAMATNHKGHRHAVPGLRFIMFFIGGAMAWSSAPSCSTPGLQFVDPRVLQPDDHACTRW
jgi:heme/copper-type cytochrome/quinol oxidase subunit 2